MSNTVSEAGEVGELSIPFLEFHLASRALSKATSSSRLSIPFLEFYGMPVGQIIYGALAFNSIFGILVYPKRVWDAVKRNVTFNSIFGIPRAEVFAGEGGGRAGLSIPFLEFKGSPPPR